MRITILSFGQVASVTGNTVVLEEAVKNTDALKELLRQRFPALGTMKYGVAVDKRMVYENTVLNENVTVALLPPFSGG